MAGAQRKQRGAPIPPGTKQEAFGKRPRGKPPGTKSMMVKARDELIVKALKGQSKTPLDIILGVMNGDTKITDRQLKAAEMAAPYIHPRLANIKAELTDDKGENLFKEMKNLTQLEAARVYAQIMNAAPKAIASKVIDMEEDD